jgi:hypothetical protein
MGIGSKDLEEFSTSGRLTSDYRLSNCTSTMKSSICSSEWVVAIPPASLGRAMRECVKLGVGVNGHEFAVDNVLSLQPHVDVSCASERLDIDNQSAFLRFYTGTSDNLTGHDTSTTVSQYLNSYNNSSDGHVLWKNPPSDFRESYSLLAIVAPPKVNDSFVEFYTTCIIRAAWLPAKLNYTRIKAATDTTKGYVDDIELAKSPWKWRPLVHISPEWASAASLPKKTYRSSLSPDIAKLVTAHHLYQEPGVKFARFQSLTIASIVATAISAVYDDDGYNLTHNQRGAFKQYVSRGNKSLYLEAGRDDDARVRLVKEQDPNRLLKVSVFRRDAWGYSTQTFPIILAICVLLLYCIYIFAFVLLGLCHRTYSDSWSSIADITALALNSKPPSHLGAISAGIDTLGVFQEPVSILENEKNTLELVFAREGRNVSGFNTVVRNRKY